MVHDIQGVVNDVSWVVRWWAQQQVVDVDVMVPMPNGILCQLHQVVHGLQASMQRGKQGQQLPLLLHLQHM